MSMVKIRQEVERKIATAAIDGLLAAGFTISVNDGDETTLEHSVDKAAILGAMFTTDEDLLIACRHKRGIGWVKFIYGNDGWDVISDYTTNLETPLGMAHKIAREYED